MRRFGIRMQWGVRDSQEHPDHCGKCGNSCPAGRFCKGGKCLGCGPGKVACDRYECTRTRTDENNCGKCGHGCPGGRACLNVSDDHEALAESWRVRSCRSMVMTRASHGSPRVSSIRAAHPCRASVQSQVISDSRSRGGGARGRPSRSYAASSHEHPVYHQARYPRAHLHHSRSLSRSLR